MEKMLVASIFTFSYNIFERLLWQSFQKPCDNLVWVKYSSEFANLSLGEEWRAPFVMFAFKFVTREIEVLFFYLQYFRKWWVAECLEFELLSWEYLMLRAFVKNHWIRPHQVWQFYFFPLLSELLLFIEARKFSPVSDTFYTLTFI